jgi:excisionase family DNA binding protein
MSDSFPDLLTAPELATKCKVHPVTIRRWTASGLIPSIKLGRCRRYRPQDVEQVLQRSKSEPSNILKIPQEAAA